jgi:hypothetical protein
MSLLVVCYRAAEGEGIREDRCCWVRPFAFVREVITSSQVMFRYCLGASIAIRLGSTDLFDSLVLCHPGTCTIEQIKAIKKPASWACAEGSLVSNATTLRMLNVS